MRLTMVVLVLVVVWAVSAFFSGRIAARTGRGARRWVILGLVLGPWCVRSAASRSGSAPWPVTTAIIDSPRST